MFCLFKIYSKGIRTGLVIGLLVLIQNCLLAQQQDISTLRKAYLNATTDSTKQDACLELIIFYSEVNRDSALFYSEERLQFSKRSGNKLMEASALNTKGYQKIQIGKYAEGLKCLMESLSITKDTSIREINRWRISPYPAPVNERVLTISSTMHQLGILMRETENAPKAIEYFKRGLELSRSINSLDRQMISSMNVGTAYFKIGQIDSALVYSFMADSLARLPQFKGIFRGRNLSNMGDIYLKIGNTNEAKQLYWKGLELSESLHNQFNVVVTRHKLAQFYIQQKQVDSALFYAKSNLPLVEILRTGANFQLNLGNVYEDVYLAYKLKKDKDSAFKYLDLAFHMKDSLYKVRISNLSAFQNMSFEETLKLETLERERIKAKAKTRLYSLLAGLIVVSLIGIILYRNNIQRQKNNKLLQNKNEEIQLQKMQVEEAFQQLKSTQSQLIQSEKMASLGELTAGIAHEIQNPLNFVNNFSEVSNELIEEMNDELNKGDINEAKIIASDIKQNLEKINHHGKRADAIVKGMLQHSRSSSGVKEPTDINALADEYLRLSYHGLRAKDKTFNADIKTDYDETIGNVNIIPQDIGRVLLNLYNNAFFAVNEKQKAESLKPAGEGKAYEPMVTVTTRKLSSPLQDGGKISIHVQDNGNGIPKNILDKIFQPFFTTKPTGQGTGLGLSLSYDIIKAHGGAIKVQTKEAQTPARLSPARMKNLSGWHSGGDAPVGRGEGTDFIIEIPITNA
jgi:signal transduction histidine kinase